MTSVSTATAPGRRARLTGDRGDRPPAPDAPIVLVAVCRLASSAETGRMPESTKARISSAKLGMVHLQLGSELSEPPFEVAEHRVARDPDQLGNFGGAPAITVDQDDGHPLAL